MSENATGVTYAMTYSSKKDVWLVSLIAAAAVAPFAVGLSMLLSDRPSPLGWVVLLIGSVSAGLVFGLAVPVSYQVTPSDLIIRSGASRTKIALASIERVRETRSPLSAAALSLDRLRVDYREGGVAEWVLISPADKAGFLRELAEWDKGLVRRGMRVERA